MPTSEAAKSVEKKYWELVRAMSPAEKVRNGLAMFQSYYTQASNRYRKEHPSISDREVRICGGNSVSKTQE